MASHLATIRTGKRSICNQLLLKNQTGFRIMDTLMRNYARATEFVSWFHMISISNNFFLNLWINFCANKKHWPWISVHYLQPMWRYSNFKQRLFWLNFSCAKPVLIKKCQERPSPVCCLVTWTSYIVSGELALSGNMTYSSSIKNIALICMEIMCHGTSRSGKAKQYGGICVGN